MLGVLGVLSVPVQITVKVGLIINSGCVSSLTLMLNEQLNLVCHSGCAGCAVGVPWVLAH